MKPIFAALFAALLLTAGIACAQPSVKLDEGSAEEAETSPSLERDHGAAANAPHQIVVCRRCRQLALGGLRNQLKDGFDDVAKLLGGELAQQHVGGAISQLEQAIESKDHEAFVSAFDRLSLGCNQCHRTLDHAFIVIRRPDLLPYSDQSFSPQQ